MLVASSGTLAHRSCPGACAAQTSARLAIDFEPGTATDGVDRPIERSQPALPSPSDERRHGGSEPARHETAVAEIGGGGVDEHDATTVALCHVDDFKLAMLTPSSAASMNSSAAASRAVRDRIHRLEATARRDPQIGLRHRALGQRVVQGPASLAIDRRRPPFLEAFEQSVQCGDDGRFGRRCRARSRAACWRPPPAASRSSAACSSARSAASVTSVAAASSPTWLTTATTWSCPHRGSNATTSASSCFDHARRQAAAGRRAAGRVSAPRSRR